MAKVGTELTVTDVTDDGKWYQVSYNGKTGYINRNMVTVDELEYSATATVTGDVNVRSGPGSEYTKLGVAKTGDKLTVTGVTGTMSIDAQHNPVKAGVIIEFVDGSQVMNTRIEP